MFWRCGAWRAERRWHDVSCGEARAWVEFGVRSAVETTSAIIELTFGCVWRAERRCQKTLTATVKLVREPEEPASDPVGYGMVFHPKTSSWHRARWQKAPRSVS